MSQETTSVAHWYVVNCYSGNEEKVKEALDNRVKAEKLEDIINETLVANYVEQSTRVNKDGTKKVVEKIKNNFPGYIFVNMKMSDQAWFIVRNTPGVTGFLGSSGKGAKPFPITQEEVLKVKELQNRIDDSQLKLKYSLNEVVEITSGAMKGQVGKVYEMNTENNTATLHVDVFGRITPVEVDMNNITKIKK